MAWCKAMRHIVLKMSDTERSARSYGLGLARHKGSVVTLVSPRSVTLFISAWAVTSARRAPSAGDIPAA